MKNICVDLDGTLAQYDGWKGLSHFGDPFPGAQDFVAKLQKMGTVVIHTTRMDVQLNRDDPLFEVETRTDERRHQEICRNRAWVVIKDWLVKHKFPKVGEIEIWLRPGKPIAAAYVDDQAVVCSPEDGITFKEALDDVSMLI